MKYCRITDDLTIPSRWHLGEVIGSDRVRDDLIIGERVSETEELSSAITHNGMPLDFCLTSFAVPVATNRLAAAISGIAGSDLQRLPLHIASQQTYEVLNSTRRVVCLDEGNSEFTKWRPDDHRADLIGQYRMVTRLAIDPALVPPDAHFFRIAGWPIGLIVSQSIKDAMVRAGCFGAKFLPVSK